MSVFDPKICQDGHTDRLDCLMAERNALKAELENRHVCETMSSSKESAYLEEIDALKARVERLREHLKTIEALHGTGHYIEGEPGHENHGCVASDIAKEALADEKEG